MRKRPFVPKVTTAFQNVLKKKVGEKCSKVLTRLRKLSHRTLDEVTFERIMIEKINHTFFPLCLRLCVYIGIGLKHECVHIFLLLWITCYSSVSYNFGA